MAWGIKKSYRVGPLKINLSKSAIGVSGRVGPFSQSFNSKKRGRSSISSNGVFYRKYESFDK